MNRYKLEGVVRDYYAGKNVLVHDISAAVRGHTASLIESELRAAFQEPENHPNVLKIGRTVVFAHSKFGSITVGNITFYRGIQEFDVVLFDREPPSPEESEAAIQSVKKARGEVLFP